MPLPVNNSVPTSATPYINAPGPPNLASRDGCALLSLKSKSLADLGLAPALVVDGGPEVEVTAGGPPVEVTAGG